MFSCIFDRNIDIEFNFQYSFELLVTLMTLFYLFEYANNQKKNNVFFPNKKD
jgi:hypothetical protein